MSNRKLREVFAKVAGVTVGGAVAAGGIFIAATATVAGPAGIAAALLIGHAGGGLAVKAGFKVRDILEP